ncbi:MAG: hypothetical protein ACFFA4_00055 [Promethearchaeota archaeon]
MEKKYGIDVAYEIDMEVWEDFYMRAARYVKKVLHLKDYSPETYFETYVKANDVLRELSIEKGEFELIGNKIISRVTYCGQWEEIQKARFTDYAKAGQMCSDAHITAHRGLMKGLFPNKAFKFNLTKRIPAGDDCCEIEIQIDRE